MLIEFNCGKIQSLKHKTLFKQPRMIVKYICQQLPKHYVRRSAQIPALLVKPAEDSLATKAGPNALHRRTTAVCVAEAEVLPGTGRDFDQAFDCASRWYQKQTIPGGSPRIT
ncbi:hypothetical protein [Undibacterium sp. TJN19]|uniref:hypothetical protein n=1 Tax=Undibacterium sp. TJN19 TaxID=3413055 RepID=UPI003BF249E8